MSCARVKHQGEGLMMLSTTSFEQQYAFNDILLQMLVYVFIFLLFFNKSVSFVIVYKCRGRGVGNSGLFSLTFDLIVGLY